MAAEGAPMHGKGSCPTPFSRWLTAQLEHKGWTQAEFARRSGIPEATVGSWIRNTRGVSVRHLEAVAQALDVSRDAVLRAVQGGDAGRGSRAWERILAWMETAPDMGASMDELTPQEVQTLWQFAFEIVKQTTDSRRKRGPRLYN